MSIGVSAFEIHYCSPIHAGFVLRSSRWPILRYVHRSERLWMPLSQPIPSGQLQWWRLLGRAKLMRKDNKYRSMNLVACEFMTWDTVPSPSLPQIRGACTSVLRFNFVTVKSMVFAYPRQIIRKRLKQRCCLHWQKGHHVWGQDSFSPVNRREPARSVARTAESVESPVFDRSVAKHENNFVWVDFDPDKVTSLLVIATTS